MPWVTRRIRTNSLQNNSCTLFDLSKWTAFPKSGSFLKSSAVITCLRSWSTRWRLCWLSTIISVSETARVFSWTLSIWFPLIVFSWFPLNADIFPFLTCEVFWSCAFWSFDRCVSSPWSSICDSLAVLDLDHFPVHTLIRRSEAEQVHVFSSCTNSPRHFSLGVSLAAYGVGSHFVSKSWM